MRCVFWNREKQRKRGPSVHQFALRNPPRWDGRTWWMGPEGGAVPCPQDTGLGLTGGLLNAAPPRSLRPGGCAGLGSPCGQTGGGQSSQCDDNTARRAHTDTVLFDGDAPRPRSPGLGSQPELSMHVGRDVLLERDSHCTPSGLETRIAGPWVRTMSRDI